MSADILLFRIIHLRRLLYVFLFASVSVLLIYFSSFIYILVYSSKCLLSLLLSHADQTACHVRTLVNQLLDNYFKNKNQLATFELVALIIGC